MSDNKFDIRSCIKGNAVGLLAIVLCVWALIRTYWYKEPVDNDLFGVIIGVLSLLVTVLIGWNIYTVIDLKQRINNHLRETDLIIADRLKKQKEESEGIIENTTIRTSHATLGMIGKAMLETHNFSSAMNFFVLAAEIAYNDGEIFDGYESYISLVDQCLDILLCTKDYQIEKTLRDNCLSNIRMLGGGSIEEIIGKLMKLKTYEVG